MIPSTDVNLTVDGWLQAGEGPRFELPFAVRRAGGGSQSATPSRASERVRFAVAVRCKIEELTAVIAGSSNKKVA